MASPLSWWRHRLSPAGWRWDISADLHLRRVLQQVGGSGRSYQPAGDIPPHEVVAATSLRSWGDLSVRSSRADFVNGGKNHLGLLLRAGLRHGLSLGVGSTVLEFGCGGARLVRHLRRLDGVRLMGCDALAGNISWCRAHVPGVEFFENELEPPLGFAADSFFDLVFAYSVLTHIPMRMQAPWVAEIARVLKPGAMAIVTVLGDEAARDMMSSDDLVTYERTGAFTMEPHHPDVSASSAHIGSWDVFMTESRMREVYEPHLDVLEYGSGFQVPVVLRRRADADVHGPRRP